MTMAITTTGPGTTIPRPWRAPAFPCAWRRGEGAAEELRVLATAFLDGYRKADDKTSLPAGRRRAVQANRFGRAGHASGRDAIESKWQLGTASPAFGSRELVYLPYPGEMVTERETMTFTYVSLTERADIDLTDMLARREER
jgi:hypothetical protein